MSSNHRLTKLTNYYRFLSLFSFPFRLPMFDLFVDCSMILTLIAPWFWPPFKGRDDKIQMQEGVISDMTQELERWGFVNFSTLSAPCQQHTDQSTKSLIPQSTRLRSILNAREAELLEIKGLHMDEECFWRELRTWVRSNYALLLGFSISYISAWAPELHGPLQFPDI